MHPACKVHDAKIIKGVAAGLIRRPTVPLYMGEYVFRAFDLTIIHGGEKPLEVSITEKAGVLVSDQLDV